MSLSYLSRRTISKLFKLLKCSKLRNNLGNSPLFPEATFNPILLRLGNVPFFIRDIACRLSRRAGMDRRFHIFSSDSEQLPHNFIGPLVFKCLKCLSFHILIGKEVGMATGRGGYGYHDPIPIPIIKIHPIPIPKPNGYTTFDSSPSPPGNGYFLIPIPIPIFLLFHISIKYFL